MLLRIRPEQVDHLTSVDLCPRGRRFGEAGDASTRGDQNVRKWSRFGQAQHQPEVEPAGEQDRPVKPTATPTSAASGHFIADNARSRQVCVVRPLRRRAAATPPALRPR
jgi:hypothetical protein